MDGGGVGMGRTVWGWGGLVTGWRLGGWVGRAEHTVGLVGERGGDGVEQGWGRVGWEGRAEHTVGFVSERHISIKRNHYCQWPPESLKCMLKYNRFSWLLWSLDCFFPSTMFRCSRK